MSESKQIQKNKKLLVKEQKGKKIQSKKHVLKINILKDKLKDSEKKIISQNKSMLTCIADFDKEIAKLNANNLELVDKIKSLEISEEVSKKCHNEIIQNINSDFINFGEIMIPKIYVRISKRFPHLNLQEIINFEKRVRENGGSILVHRGEFVLTDRCEFPDRNTYRSYNSWNCCKHMTGGFGGIGQVVYSRLIENEQGYKPFLFCSIEKYKQTSHYDRDPSSLCDITEIFCISDADEEIIDISKITVQDVTSCISYNVNVLEKTIEEYSIKILKMKGIKDNLDLLINV